MYLPSAARVAASAGTNCVSRRAGWLVGIDCRWWTVRRPSSGWSMTFVPSCAVEHLVARPQLGEGRAGRRAAPRSARRKARVAVAAGVRGAEARERVARGRLPGRPAPAGVGEHPPQQVLRRRPARATASPSMRGRPPRSRPARRCAGRAGRPGSARSASTIVARAPAAPRSGTARRRRDRDAGEVEQVRALGRVEVEHPGERVEHARRRRDVAALLEPRVPGQPDPGELRDLLAAQPGRAAPAVRAAGRRSRGVVRSRCVAQELRELVAARGWWCESQDRCPFLSGAPTLAQPVEP